MRTRVKICGITQVSDALAAVNAGCDALGFVFYPPSPRSIDAEQVKDILASVPAFVTSTALFVDPDPEFVRQVIAISSIDLLQFHGDESPSFCESFERPYIKALRMRPDTDLTSEFDTYASSQGILLDTFTPGVPGGTGETFDWSRIDSHHAPKIILAGGLTPGNVRQAINSVGPYAVDVSGGVESSKGIKDSSKLISFMNEVYRANNR